jgi:acyl-CoA reductase-like NAD-dependent aldehyde dehydrogenase
MMAQQACEIQPRQFINGKWVSGTSDKVLANINPYDRSTIFEMRPPRRRKNHGARLRPARGAD